MAPRFPRLPVHADRAGIGLRRPHFEAVAEQQPPVSLLEVHSENYFADGGPALAWLERFRAHYPVSLHGVGMSLGSWDPLDRHHLASLARLAQRIEPTLVSEHLCWSSFGGRHFNELLPLPYSEEALAHVTERVCQVQEFLGRPILVENVSAYVRYCESTLPEGEFVAEVARRSGCGVLLDVNNAWVNAMNHGTDAGDFLAALDGAMIGEIHLAGPEWTDDGWIDTHGTPVRAEVWALFEEAIRRFGTVPTVIEWDTAIPELDVLLGDVHRANVILAGGWSRK